MSARKTVDAIELLKEDHKVVQDMFKEFKKLHEAKEEGSEEMKQELMDSVCAALKIHTQIEEEIFYPAAREALEDEEDLMNEAEVEHTGAEDLIADIEDGSASDPMTCARFMVLSEQIDHHVKEEHEEMFPKLRKADFDAAAVGEEMAQRKAELEGEKPAMVPAGNSGKKQGSRPPARG
jgi:hemerythrin-like domain-containing protein